MEIAYQILRNHVDLICFSALALVGLVFCQLIMRSAQPGSRLPLRNLVGTLVVAALCLGATFGLSRIFEHRQITTLGGYSRSASFDLAALGGTPETLKNSPELTKLTARWKSEFPGLSQALISESAKDGADLVLFDSGIDLNGDGQIDTPEEQALAFGTAVPFPTLAITPEKSWALANFFTKTKGTSFVTVSSTDALKVSLRFQAADWCEAIIATRLIILVDGLAVILLLLSRPCLECVHSAELQRRLRIESSLQHAKEVADADSRMKGELMAVLTHEIRTPLTAIMGFSRVLLDSELDTVQHRHVETVVSAGDRIAGILNDIIDLTKIEEGKLTLDLINHSPLAILSEMVDLMTSRATKKKLSLRLETPLRESFSVRGDPSRVRQIVLRLLDNAIKYTERGTVTVRLLWKVDDANPTSGRLVISVQDTGPGISADRLPTLFTSFRHEHGSNRRYEGTGLSLVMVKRLAELMGGTLTVESSFGVGSTFTLSLPCAPSATNVATIPPFDNVGTAPPVVRRGLVVDDQALNREIVRLMLQRLGYLADTASSGQEAIAMTQTEAYDVIIMDIDMPGLDGYETTRNLRKHAKNSRHIPIIAVTGLTDKGTREKCLAAGMDEYLTKPVYAPALKSTVEAVFAAHQ